MNSLKYKKKEETSIFHSIQSPNKIRFEKFNFVNQKNQNQAKNKIQPIKLQRSYRQPRIIVKKQRYDSIQDVVEKNQKIRSLSIKRNQENAGKNLQQSIKLFKNSTRNKQLSLNSSLQKSRQSESPYTNQSKKLLLNKKLTIIQRETNIRNRVFQNESRSKSKNHFRAIKSTFTKLDSLQFSDSLIDQSTERLKKSKQKSNIIRRSSPSSVDLIKKLIKSQKYRQALLIIKKAFSQQNDKQNLELLELFATCMYNLEQYQQLTKICQQIFTIKPDYSSQIYIMGCLSWAKVKNYPKSLQIIEKGSLLFPKNAQIFYYKGKILLHMKKYADSQQSFDKSYFICALPQTLICLSDCYKKTNQRQKEFQALEKLLSQKNLYLQQTFNFQVIFVRKLRVLYELNRYEELNNQVLTCSRVIQSFKNPELKAEVEYISALSIYKRGKHSKAFQKFQDCLINQYFYLKALKMLIVLQIIEKNFYEAFHLCSQVQKQNYRVQQDQVFNLLTTFVQGAINLVRRNFKEGIQILSKVQLSLQNKQFVKYIHKQEFQEYEIAQNHESFKAVNNLLHLFMSYGLFCIGQYEFCQSAIKIQRQLYNDSKYEKGLRYNYKLCSAILSFQQKTYSEALMYLEQADEICPLHMQVFFYRAVILIQIFVHKIQSSQGQQKLSQANNRQMMSQIKLNFEQALKRVSTTANNTRATILYFQSLFHSYIRQWKQAINAIEQCIAKTDDNYWRYYYTKAMILACVHSFQEAVSQLSIAINLSEGQRAECFLLRSKCLQIEGKGNDAFYDLQQYIALRPEDQDVHMYAGQLLFQNGAFQDAIVAFQHKEIQQIPQNHDVFLTIAKTFFLTGKFLQAQQKMFLSYKLNCEDKEIQFDAKITKFTDLLIKQINQGKIQQTSHKFSQQLQEFFDLQNKNKTFGKIFRQMDIYLFRALIALYSGGHVEAISNFQKLLSERRKNIIFDEKDQGDQSKFIQFKNQDDLDKISNQLEIYTNQMKYNITLCHLLDGDLQNAKSILKSIRIDQKQTFYSDFVKFKTKVSAQNFTFQKEQIFPNKNKLSQFLPELTIYIKHKKVSAKLRLCIPFPKVQPPEIFPTFQNGLLRTLTIHGIEGKPEAPWIAKQDNVIKFTQRIQHFSSLDFNDSEPTSSATAIIDIGESKVSSRNKFTQKQKSHERSSMFSKRTLKKKSSISNNF